MKHPLPVGTDPLGKYVYTTASNGIPHTFAQQTSSSRTFIIQKGQLNKYRLRPAILNEHAESSREIQSVVSSGNIVSQGFKASKDNINGCLLTLESAAGTSVDNFESYADSAALQAAWVTVGSEDDLLETTIVKTGDKSMELPIGNADGDWVKTFLAQNYEEFTFEFDFYQTVLSGGPLAGIVDFYISDGTNTKRQTINVPESLTWIHVEIDEINMVEDGGITDMTAITKMGFDVTLKRTGASSYVDNILAAPFPGSLRLELWDMGTELPKDGITSLNDGVQYDELGDRGLNGGSVSSSVVLQLQGGKRLYTVRGFIAGVAEEIPDNTKLTIGNYYALTLNYIDTDVNVFGPNSAFGTDYYESGFAFTAPDTNTPISAIGEYNDLMFGIFSTQCAWINTLLKFYDAVPGNDANEYVFVEDKNMKVTSIIAGENTPQQTLLAEFNDRFFELPMGGKFEVYHNDDFSDDTTQITVLIGYLFEPPTANG